MYKIGDYVVKASNGVCEIQDILHLDMPGMDEKKLYYLLVPKDSKKSKVYVPVDRGDESLRRVLNEHEAWDVIRRIPETKYDWSGNDKMRELEYKEAIRNCRPEELIGIIKSLYLRKQERSMQGKRSTATDDRYFRQAEEILYSELSFAIGRDKSELQRIILEIIQEKDD